MKVKQSAEEAQVNVLGLRVQRKTDVLALTAFIISLLTGLMQVVEWYRGPKIALYTPERVVIYSYPQADGGAVVRVAAQMSYTNSSSAQYSGSVKSEQVTLKIGAVSATERSVTFAQLRREGSHFSPAVISDAAPFPVSGGGSVSHSTLFSAFPRICAPVESKCDRYADFVNDDDLTKALNAERIELEFVADIYDGKLLSVKCYLPIDKFVRAQWLSNGSFTERCEPSSN